MGYNRPTWSRTLSFKRKNCNDWNHFKIFCNLREIVGDVAYCNALILINEVTTYVGSKQYLDRLLSVVG